MPEFLAKHGYPPQMSATTKVYLPDRVQFTVLTLRGLIVAAQALLQRPGIAGSMYGDLDDDADHAIAEGLKPSAGLVHVASFLHDYHAAM